MRVKFGPWLPDQPDLDSGGLEECTNCIPLDSGYGSLRTLVTLSGSVSCPRVVSSLMVREDDGAYLFVGITAGTNGTQLGRFFYAANATDTSLTFANVSRTASYSLSLGIYPYYWSLAAFGSNVYAVNGVDPMQVGSTSTVFRDQSASASAPVAFHLAAVRDFLFAGNIASGGAGAGSNRLQWCQINNPQRWTPSPRSQSDFQDLPDTGEILAMTGGDFLTVFTERAIWRGTYVGSPVIFRFDQVAPNVQLFSPASVARYQNLTFFLGKSGFQAFDGAQCIPIGNSSVDRFALSLVQSTNSRSANLRGIVDHNNKMYVVVLRSGAELVTDGNDAQRLAVYNISSGRWSLIDLGDGASSQVMQITESITLAAHWPTAATSLPANLPPFRRLDSRPGIGVFLAPNTSGNTNNKYTEPIGSLGVAGTETYLTATFATGEAQIFSDHRAFVRGIRPLIQGDSNTSVSVEVGRRNLLNESVTYGASTAVNANGLAPLRSDGRYHRVRVKVSGGFDRAIGFDIDAIRSGKR